MAMAMAMTTSHKNHSEIVASLMLFIYNTNMVRLEHAIQMMRTHDILKHLQLGRWRASV